MNKTTQYNLISDLRIRSHLEKLTIK